MIYLTTAIPYVNGAPHAGHALDYLLADVYKRFLEQQGIEVRLQAGTDEHGNKIWKKSQDLGLPVEEYTKTNSDKFKDFIASLGVIPTDFIRTTDAIHAQRCQQIWQKLQPHIYSAEYDGWYCSGCESFITEKEYQDNHGVCPDHNAPYEHLSESNYYLRISDFKDQIKDKIVSGELQILPDFRQKEVLRLLETSPDVSISRPKKHLSWGIPVPGDDSQVIYVWLDALTNYITVLGYPDFHQDPEAEVAFDQLWPAAVQFVGKDILRFHAIIWPAILLGLGLPLPKVLHSHGHVLSSGQKMSKTLGNVIDPLEVLHRHGLDSFRYFFLRHIDTFADSDFTWDKFEAAYTGELANDLGNLVSRLATLCAKNSISLTAPEKATHFNTVLAQNPEYQSLMDSLNFTKAFDYVWAKVQDLNKQIDEQKPWALAKTNPAQAQVVLQNLALSLLEVSTLLSPFLPETSAKIQKIFTAKTITPPAPLFPKG